ncbi:MAG TPA: Lsr2 family protein [Micromonosporaceae bacterium]
MARTVRVHLLDDLDGSTADETVKFALDGTPFEIDLSAEHCEQFRKALAKYIVAGRRASHGIVTGGRSPRGAGASSRARNQAIREWARGEGYDINDRGRIPAGMIEQYERDNK